MPASILIVDDESGIRESLGALLRDEGYDAEAVASGEECLDRLKRRNFDLVLLDVWLNGMDGLDTLERMQEHSPAPMVVMISGHGNIETAVRATKLGAFDFIEKPLSVEKVVLVARNALEYLRLEEENRRLRAELAKLEWVPRFDVDVRVKCGVVELVGVIPDERERAALRVLAANTAGAKGVRDNLTCIEPMSGAVIDQAS